MTTLPGTIERIAVFEDVAYSLSADGFGDPLDPQPVFVRAHYLEAGKNLQEHWPTIREKLFSFKPSLLLTSLSSPDGPPYRLARTFYNAGESGLSIRGRATVTPTTGIQLYAHGPEGQPWDEDRRRGLGYGLFITGDSGPATVWRIVRVERDIARRPLFTLSPLQLAPEFPLLDLSFVEDTSMKKVISEKYEELQRCILANSYESALTQAKNIMDVICPQLLGHRFSSLTPTSRSV